VAAHIHKPGLQSLQPPCPVAELLHLLLQPVDDGRDPLHVIVKIPNGYGVAIHLSAEIAALAEQEAEVAFQGLQPH
jgi:hypothetical protein